MRRFHWVKFPFRSLFSQADRLDAEDRWEGRDRCSCHGPAARAAPNPSNRHETPAQNVWRSQQYDNLLSTDPKLKKIDLPAASLPSSVASVGARSPCRLIVSKAFIDGNNASTLRASSCAYDRVGRWHSGQDVVGVIPDGFT